jgi:hypothetical protein
MGEAMMVESGRRRFGFFHPATVTAKFYFVPDPLPLFPPLERPPAGGANFLGQLLFLHALMLGSRSWRNQGYSGV